MPCMGSSKCIPYPYSYIIQKPDPAVEYYESYKDLGNKRTRFAQSDLFDSVFQPTLDALPLPKGVFIKAGTFYTYLGADVDSNVEIHAEGMGVTTIRRNADVPILRYYEHDGLPSYQMRDALSDICLDAHSTGTGFVANTLELSQTRYCLFRNLYLLDNKGNDIYIKGDPTYIGSWTGFENINVKGYANGYGAGIYTDVNATDNFVRQLTLTYKKYGIYFGKGGWYLEDIWPVAVENALYIKASGIRGSRIIPDSTTKHAIYIDASAAGVGSIFLDHIHPIAPAANFDLIYVDVGNGLFCSDVSLRDIDCGSNAFNYIVEKAGAGALQRWLIDGVFVPTGALGRYLNVDDKYIKNDMYYETDHTLLMGTIDGLTPGVTKYFTAIGRAAVGAAPTGYYAVIGRAGVIHNLRARVNQAPAGAETAIFTLYLNGAPTALTCTIAGAALEATDTVNTVNVAVSDRICMQAVNSASSASLAGYTYMELDE